ncbi:chemotaxis protein CheX [Timonella sp. A28]|uniref:chemotaxis protein CheX n=1 Tax=Timonella sp. A28 TaxID=3442640 RepID=UPI003EB931F8
MSPVQIAVSKDQILAIVQEVFAAMLDAGEICVFESGPSNTDDETLSAWVDMQMELPEGPLVARALVRTQQETAHEIVRSLLMMGSDEEISYADLTDAFGEIANVVGGNVKSLVEVPARLSLPSVSNDAAHGPNGLFLQDLDVNWRGQHLNVSLWILPNSGEWS